MLGQLLFSLLALCLATSALNAQPSADSSAVHKAHLQWFEGLVAEDTTRLSPVLAPDVTLAFPGGDIMPRRDFLGYLQNGQLYYDTAEHHNLHIRVYPGAAVVNGSFDTSLPFSRHRRFGAPYLYSHIHSGPRPMADGSLAVHYANAPIA